MTDAELRATLADRLAAVDAHIRAACGRAGRGRDAVTLVAVTKSASVRVATVMAEVMADALGPAGVHLGEGRPQELWRKAEAVPAAAWHLVGNLQRNKLDRTLALSPWVHAVDRASLLGALAEAPAGAGRAFIEFNCSREPSKAGFAPEAISAVAERLQDWRGVPVVGLMTMAAHRDDPQECRAEFAELRGLRDKLRAATGLALPHLSMGMSNDFEVAVEEGATFVRVGTTLFQGLEGE